MSIEAMKQALEALQNIHPGNMTPMAEEAWDKAIASLRQAIEQAEQDQPVAWCVIENGRVKGLCKSRPAVMNADKWQPLYTAPPPRQPLTEEEMYLAIRPLFKTDALATSALQISKDEYRAIEAAHGIKGEE